MTDKRAVIIVIDALRPDHVTEGSMPTLWDLAQRGVRFEDHHTLLPSKTRASSATIATGCYPTKHGLVNNQLYVAGEVIDVSDFEQLQRLDNSSDGPLLAVPTTMERLARAGLRVALSTASSSGTTFIQNPKMFGFGVNNSANGFVYPADRKEEIISRFGPAPLTRVPDIDRNRYAAEVLTEYILPELKPHLALIWFSDPDKTQHRYGPGSPETFTALRVVDQCIASIVAKLKELDLFEQTDLLILSDHGCISAAPDCEEKWSLKDKVPPSLAAKFEVIDGNYIYVHPEEKSAVPELVYYLQQQPDIGAIFSNCPEAGTLPLSLVGQEHRRSPDIMICPRWVSDPNGNGAPGIAKGIAKHGHGGSSPFEMNSFFAAFGPSFKEKTVIKTPSGNVDIAPTVLHLFSAEVDTPLDGRVLTEALRDGEDGQAAVIPEEYFFSCAAEYAGFSYEATANFVKVGDTFYLREANGRSRRKG